MDEICERLIIKALEKCMESKEEPPLMINPVKPRVKANEERMVGLMWGQELN